MKRNNLILGDEESQKVTKKTIETTLDQESLSHSHYYNQHNIPGKIRGTSLRYCALQTTMSHYYYYVAFFCASNCAGFCQNKSNDKNNLPKCRRKEWFTVHNARRYYLLQLCDHAANPPGLKHGYRYAPNLRYSHAQERQETGFCWAVPNKSSKWMSVAD